jgi:hypothetical protein
VATGAPTREQPRQQPRQQRCAVWQRQDFIGGCLVIAVAAFAYYQGLPLSFGTMNQVGPGMLPQALAIFLGALGLLLLLSSIVSGGERIDGLTWRGPLFVLAAVVVFGLSIRPLGLIVAGPLAFGIGALASSEVRPGETVLIGAAMTAGCIALFKLALGLPIPLAPWWLGY